MQWIRKHFWTLAIATYLVLWLISSLTKPAAEDRIDQRNIGGQQTIQLTASGQLRVLSEHQIVSETDLSDGFHSVDDRVKELREMIKHYDGFDWIAEGAGVLLFSELLIQYPETKVGGMIWWNPSAAQPSLQVRLELMDRLIWSSFSEVSRLLDILIPFSKVLPVSFEEVSWKYHLLSNLGQTEVSEQWIVIVGEGEVSTVTPKQSQILQNKLPQPTTSLILSLMGGIALATLVSEDLACIGAGLLVQGGGLGFAAGCLACFLGIFIGDMMLYFLGRWFGEWGLQKRPFRWVVKPETLHSGEVWFEQKGLWLILASRFMPGTRVPVYLAAGVLKANALKVAGVMAAAAIFWVPVIVGVSYFAGMKMVDFFEKYEQFAIWILLGIILTVFFLTHQLLPLLSFRGRRLLYSRWKRLTRWEFWPAKVIYLPVFSKCLYLAMRYKGFSTFTLANPMMPCGGLVDESKSEILSALEKAGAPIAPFMVFEPQESSTQTLQPTFPVVVKPDQGERGKGVNIVHDQSQWNDHLSSLSGKQILQEYVGGIEFGVLYRRLPNEEQGHISSITKKVYTSVTGDGTHDLEHLILSDSRAVLSARKFLKNHQANLHTVPPKGEKISLIDIGTHSRGSLFLDVNHLTTETLVRVFDGFSKNMPGFHMGRFDVKVPNEESLKKGEDIRILELNLLTSEPTHMYDPKHSLFYAWKVLSEQWTFAHEVGLQNLERGLKPMSSWQILRKLANHYFG